MIELVPTDVAHGGEAVARHQGKAHFVAGAIPGERVMGEVSLDKGSWARVELRSVLEPSEHRVEPGCPHFDVCGGCQWQFADYQTQLAWKASILRGQLQHIGRIPDPPVGDTVATDEPYAYRNRMDFRIAGGRPALHKRRSKQLVALDVCRLLQPSLKQRFDQLGDLTGVTKLTIRSSATNGEALFVVSGDVPLQAPEWDASVVHRAGRSVETLIGPGTVHENVGGVDFRIKADAFFQNNTAGAATLVNLVDDALDLQPDETLLDAYAGGGLFSATVGQGADRVIAVEGSRLALADLRRNLKKAGMGEARVVGGDVRDVIHDIDEYWQAAIVDPPRSGLGEDGVDAVTAAGPRVVVYVSCDPASLARDSRLLAESGYGLTSAIPVDLFPQTFHIETVATFELGADLDLDPTDS